jgi:integrase
VRNPEQFLDESLNASGLAGEPSAPLFPTLRHGKLTGRTRLPEANVHMMIQRPALAAGIRTKISAHRFRYRNYDVPAVPAERRQARIGPADGQVEPFRGAR